MEQWLLSSFVRRHVNYQLIYHSSIHTLFMTALIIVPWRNAQIRNRWLRLLTWLTSSYYVTIVTIINYLTNSGNCYRRSITLYNFDLYRYTYSTITSRRYLTETRLMIGPDTFTLDQTQHKVRLLKPMAQTACLVYGFSVLDQSQCELQKNVIAKVKAGRSLELSA